MKKPTRYFIYDLYPDFADELEIMEVNKETFDRTHGEIDIVHHTLFENGVDQTCHIKKNY